MWSLFDCGVQECSISSNTAFGSLSISKEDLQCRVHNGTLFDSLAVDDGSGCC